MIVTYKRLGTESVSGTLQATVERNRRLNRTHFGGSRCAITPMETAMGKKCNFHISCSLTNENLIDYQLLLSSVYATVMVTAFLSTLYVDVVTPEIRP